MRQDVTKGNDVSIIADLVEERRIRFLNSIERFADDLEFPFDSASEQFAFLIILKAFSGHECLYRPRRLLDIMEMFE